MMTINNCDSQIGHHKQEIFSSEWLILCVTMRITYNIAFTVTDLPFLIWTLLKKNYLKRQVLGQLLNQVISEGFQICNDLLEPSLNRSPARAGHDSTRSSTKRCINFSQHSPRHVASRYPQQRSGPCRPSGRPPPPPTLSSPPGRLRSARSRRASDARSARRRASRRGRPALRSPPTRRMQQSVRRAPGLCVGAWQGIHCWRRLSL